MKESNLSSPLHLISDNGFTGHRGEHDPDVISFFSCGGRNRTCGPVVQSNGFLPAETTPHCVFCFSGSRGTRTHNAHLSAPVFETGPSSSRMTSVNCGGRTRTCSLLLNRESPYHWATPHHILYFTSERPAGIEPTHLLWQSSRQPLHHRR